MKRVILGLAVGTLIAGAGPATAYATPAEGDIERTDIAKGTTDVPIAIVAVGQPTTLYVQNLALGPASSSGWHSHPGPEYSVINEGTLHLQTANGCAPAAFGAGQAIFIPAGVPHVVSNTGAEHAAATVTYTVPADRAVRDDAPAACP
ncbi:Cupin domain-containing protein [Mycolicibacterium rutilum]|uniref:Cupin domain-containing protein n=1 Tax=Mycolicibacterium rutilum TaxID=370526 RepID=A0A1H6IXG8_MYCRU|nr:cupin domain-containing protein [Mycolicibacterium rutilum]SEH51165.1 Cupin domain-containing protein [Mycolicibacterium rutilum]